MGRLCAENLAALMGTAAFAMLAHAGPITPPPGPVSGTHKTLTEVEPRIAINAVNTPGDGTYHLKITQPGSYYLTGNVTGVSGKYGIGIAVSGVTIDLNGFELVGVTGSTNGIQGLFEGIERITILNGTVRNWGGSGVYIGGGSYGSSSGCRIDGIVAQHNGGTGITAGFWGSNCVITNCAANSNDGTGIAAYSGAVIQSCVASTNGTYGIVAGPGTIVRDCAATSNDSHGIYGDRATIIDCGASSNDGDGIYVIDASLVRGNRCHSNGAGSGNDGANIHVLGRDNRIEGNNCLTSDRGIDVDEPGNFIAGNTCSGNTSNWSVVAGNVCYVVSATTAAAIEGSSGGTSPGSTSAWANFSY